jgi:hypothetical protein
MVRNTPAATGGDGAGLKRPALEDLEGPACSGALSGAQLIAIRW